MSTALLHYGANERRAVMLDKLGGKPVLQQAIDKFYDRQTHDERLMKFFKGTDMAILKWHQFNLMSIAFTSVPENFDVEHLISKRHQRLFDDGLDETYFDVVMEHFSATLEEMNVDKNLVNDAMAVVLPLRSVFEIGAQQARERKKSQKLRNQRDLLLVVVSMSLFGFGVSKLLRRVRK